MAKDTFYFTHDFNSRNDEKIKKLIRFHGMNGYGVFWSIVEDLYNNANALRLDYIGIAYDLRTDLNIVKSIINDFDLFVIDNDIFGSLSIENRLNERKLKSAKASESAYCRWGKAKEDANALRLECDGNAIKERKGNKEIKEIKDSKEPPPKKVVSKMILFKESNINNLETFTHSFLGSQYEHANFAYYFEVVSNWAASKAEKKIDWIAAVRGWMARDLKDGKFIKNDYNPQKNVKNNGFTREGLQAAFDARFADQK